MRAAIVPLVALLLLLPSVSAHANAGRTFPQAGARFELPPSEAWVDFTEDIDPATTRVEAFDGSQRRVDEGPVMFEGRRHASVALREELPTGGYIVRWSTVSTADGHPTSGSFSFAVGDAPVPDAPPSTPPAPRWDAIAGKAMVFLGLALVAGALAALTWFVPASLRPLALVRLRPWMTGGAVLHVVGLVTLALAQSDATGRAVSNYFLETVYGRGVLARITAGLVLVGVSRLRAVHAVRWIMLPATVVSLSLTGAYSHTAGVVRPFLLGTALDTLHLATVTAWAGGLAFFTWFLLRPLAREGLGGMSDRFSRMATVCVVVLGLTGLWMAAALLGWDLGRWWAARSTPYGIVLAVKVGLAVAMILLGAVNRWVHVSATRRGATEVARRGFARNAGREAMLGLVVFLVAGGLTNLSPSTPAAPRAPAMFEAIERGDAFEVQLLIDPWPQVDTTSHVEARITLVDGGGYVENATRVRFTFIPPDPTLGGSSLLATHGTEGRYALHGAFFPLAGGWGLNVTVQTPEVYEDVVPFHVDAKPSGGA